MAENHMSSFVELLYIVPGSPVPGEPFEVLWIDEIEFISILFSFIIVCVPALSSCSVSSFVFSSLDAVNNVFVRICSVLSNHSIEENVPNGELESHGIIGFPLLEFGL